MASADVAAHPPLRASLGRNLASGGVALALIVVFVAAPGYMSPSLLTYTTTALVLAVVVYGVDLLHGTTKLLSLAHVGIWAVTAYTFIEVLERLHWSIWLAAASSVVAAILLASVAGAFVFRTAGFYFAILTLALSEAARIAISNMQSVTGGEAGATLSGAMIGSTDLTAPRTIFYVALAACALTLIAVRLIVRSPLGLKARAIGESDAFAASLGIDLYRTKLVIFVLSAIPVGLAGILFPIEQIAITTNDFDVNKVLAVVLVALLGGSGHWLGPLVGALFYIIVPNYLPISPSVTEAGMGLLLIAVIAIGRRGIAPTIEDGVRLGAARAGRWRHRSRAAKGARDDG